MARPRKPAPPRRAVLFFPANRPERFEKAIATGADCICIDLEDAVAPEAKDAGRSEAAALLSAPLPSAEIIVRVNDVRTDVGYRDLEMLTQLERQPDAVMLPKVDGPEQLRWASEFVATRRPELPLIALIETTSGLERVFEIARAGDALSALLIGGVDLSTELGCAIEWDALLYARSRVVHAAADAGIDAIDTPSLDLTDADALARETRAVARLGFTGKAVIHPSQVPVVQQAFVPDAGEVAKARDIVSAYEASGGNAVLLDGRVIERPVLLAARRTIALHEAFAARRLERNV